MKRLLLLFSLFIAVHAYTQTTYYWVGSNPTANGNINTTSNWNTVLNGTGSSRTSNTSADILIFDGSNLGGMTEVTGTVTVNAASAITCARLVFTNNADIKLIRPTSGTTTITMVGDGNAATEDLVVDAGSKMQVTSTAGSFRIDMTSVECSGRVSGELNMITTQQSRIGNMTTGTGKMTFTSGSAMHSNITGSSSYAFGNSSQSAEKWVIFEAGSHLYYDGGNSPMASSAAFTPIDMQPGSVWHHRANNGAGTYFNRRSFGDIVVENNATLTSDGPIYRIGNLTVANGSSFITHTSGVTAVTGNVVVDGALTSPADGSNELFLAGTTPQSISGSGTIDVSGMLVAANATVTLDKDVTIDDAATVYGKLNFGTHRLTGAGTFKANGAGIGTAFTADASSGSYLLTGNTVLTNTQRGQIITGAGIPANTVLISTSTTGDSLYLSQNATATGTAVAMNATNDNSVLQTANANGFDPASGSASLSGIQTFESGIGYIIDAATSSPFGITTGSTDSHINAGFIEINAPVVSNLGADVADHLSINGKFTLRATDTLRLSATAVLNGSFSASNYIATGYDAANDHLARIELGNVSGATIVPVGTENSYLPITINPATAGGFSVSVFEGITTNGLLAGTAFTPSQLQKVVNAVWQVQHLTGSGGGDLQLNWTPALEGSTFTTLTDAQIGLIQNSGTWSAPSGVADNTANMVTASVADYGLFAVGAVAQTEPFLFNPLPDKIYGDVDFNGGATSLNTTQPIIYTSSNPAVATIVNGDIHITGAGTTTITATQATDGFYPAVNLSQSLAVAKAPLTITADDKLKFEGQANPALTATYTGLVPGESEAALATLPTISTTAVTGSLPGTYPITVSGAVSPNYEIAYVNGVLTIQARTSQTITFAAPANKTYGNADFASGVSSTNTTLPVVLTSSNTNVATIIGSTIHITGAGSTTITASQAGNPGYFPAVDVVRTLTVAKAPLAIRVRDTTRAQGVANPPFTITYTGFVLGETAASLSSPAVATTTATLSSTPGNYPITLGGTVTNNYAVTYTNARLTVQPANGAEQSLYAFTPDNNTLRVRVYSPKPTLADITLFTISGAPVARKNIFMPKGFVEANINIGTMASGIYFITIKGDGVDLKTTVRIVR